MPSREIQRQARQVDPCQIWLKQWNVESLAERGNVPVPIARHTTFAQFRDHLQFLGCGYGDLPLGFSRAPMVYFERAVNGVLRDAVLKKRADDEEVAPTQIQGLCAKLEIDPAEFGFQYP